MNTLEGYSIAIPAYGRPREFEELLTSILDSSIFPDEVIACEDFSPERSDITKVALRWTPLLESKGIKFSYIENDRNLGYDGNVRKLIESAAYKWVILMGDDDVILKDGLSIIKEFCLKNPNVSMISRPFLRFVDSINHPLGVSKVIDHETIVQYGGKFPSGFIFRTCGFVGGLVINKIWASQYHTSKFDGSLFYQIFLGAHAYCTNGIGYLASPSVGARTDNPPLFGNAGAEDHIPGSYSAKGRARMWKGVLTIADAVGKDYGIDLKEGLSRELMVRQAFHVFEMNSKASKVELMDLKNELIKLNLYNHWFPKTLYTINITFGKYSKLFYTALRKVMQ